jgi:peptidoglycan/xylan/chitin deacetylase (PgdA/CDA1 family)
MMMYHKIINKLLRTFEVRRIPTKEKTVFLTFDDGPETEITEFILELLDDYGYKGTFFCRGDNAEIHPELLALLRERGHSIGNHTYSHIHSYGASAKIYSDDVKKANNVLHATLFRPPHGSLTFCAWLKLCKRYRIVCWSINSGDSDLEKFDYQKQMNNLKKNTKPGDIVLFHFCHRHETETKLLLPDYLKWLNEQGYNSKSI